MDELVSGNEIGRILGKNVSWIWHKPNKELFLRFGSIIGKGTKRLYTKSAAYKILEYEENKKNIKIEIEMLLVWIYENFFKNESMKFMSFIGVSKTTPITAIEMGRFLSYESLLKVLARLIRTKPIWICMWAKEYEHLALAEILKTFLLKKQEKGEITMR